MDDGCSVSALQRDFIRVIHVQATCIERCTAFKSLGRLLPRIVSKSGCVGEPEVGHSGGRIT